MGRRGVIGRLPLLVDRLLVDRRGIIGRLQLLMGRRGVIGRLPLLIDRRGAIGRLPLLIKRRGVVELEIGYRGVVELLIGGCRTCRTLGSQRLNCRRRAVGLWAPRLIGCRLAGDLRWNRRGRSSRSKPGPGAHWLWLGHRRCAGGHDFARREAWRRGVARRRAVGGGIQARRALGLDRRDDVAQRVVGFDVFHAQGLLCERRSSVVLDPLGERCLIVRVPVARGDRSNHAVQSDGAGEGFFQASQAVLRAVGRAAAGCAAAPRLRCGGLRQGAELGRACAVGRQ